MAKEIKYTTIEQQIKKLQYQQLAINNLEYARKNLELFGYSNLIKSYREPYIIKNNNQIQYRAGVSFEQIRSLYILDKNLRNSVMAAMQDLEEHIKESAASVISKSFGTSQDKYLIYRNYKNKKKSKYRFTLPGILDTLRSTLDTDKNPIHHYKCKYGDVPPWILFKSIYFSTIINFIDLFKSDEQIALVNKLYDSKNIGLSEKQLRILMMDTLFICLEYRNIAAHGGRIYNHNSKYHLRADEIFGADRNVKVKGLNQLIFLLDLFEYKSPYQRLYSVLEAELTRHCSHFPQDVTYLGQILNINIVPTEVVYISKNSNIYHGIPHCSGIKNATQLNFEDVKNKGYLPCKKCIKTSKGKH